MVRKQANRFVWGFIFEEIVYMRIHDVPLYISKVIAYKEGMFAQKFEIMCLGTGFLRVRMLLRTTRVDERKS